MSVTYASNAVLSKVRAMYGFRLTDKNYLDLLACSSVTEVASYLKNRTRYKDVLSTLSEKNVHRGQLEYLLRKKLFNDFESIGRYEISVGEEFFNYVISRMEIEEIMHFLILFISSKPEDYIYSFPVFFSKHTNIDIKSFNKVKTYEDFLNTLEKSEYFDILSKFNPNSKRKDEESDKLDIAIIESALFTNLYKKVFAIIKNKTNGSARSELSQMFDTFIDFSNITKIYRLKKYYNADDKYIYKCLIHLGTFSKKTIQNMVHAESAEQIIDMMKQTSVYKKYEGKLKCNHIGEVPYSIEFEKCRHYIRFSVNPSVVMMAYIFLMENEISNIVNIIEGVRYELPSDDIKDMLII